MKKVLILILSVFVCSVVFAQATEGKKSTFQLSFFPPLGTNGLQSGQYTNKISFNILAGTSRNEEAFTFGGLSNVILNNARGVQFAGLSNYVGNSGKGLQFAGLVNINRKDFAGLQFAGLMNTAKGMKGLQFAGLFNQVRGDGKGLLFAGLANSCAKNYKGVQFAGIVNTAKNLSGMQYAGLVNVAKNVKGFQFAGLVNIAKTVKGVQFAGLVNVAEKSDCPIGLVNIIKKGEKGIAVTYDATGSMVVSFRSGGKYTYGIVGVGYNHKTEGRALVTEGGFGAHIPVVSWFRINNEIKISSIGCDSEEPVLNAGYSFIPAFRIGRHVELFAGAGVNYMESKDTDNDKIFPDHSLWKKKGSAKWQQLYIGYQFGLQYIF